jgi:hypothetical protein
MNAETSRFSFWVIFHDRRAHHYGKAGRKDLIKFFTDALGPLGENWQYEKTHTTFCIKLNRDIDATMFVLKYCKV